jgi:dextranase
MMIRDVYPNQGTFQPGEEVIFCLILDMNSYTDPGLEIKLTIWQIENQVSTVSYRIRTSAYEPLGKVSWSPPMEMRGGFGVQAELIDSSGKTLVEKWTAFDILEDWTEFPRYGFMTDFFPNRHDLQETIATMARYHINGLQFYDWQYRHESLIPPRECYEDPLGRELSERTIRECINLGHTYGMKTMPYMAVYAASLPFWESHPTWALFDENGNPLQFEGFLGLMDPSPGSPWVRHIEKECERILAEYPFDGIHIDQYGDPKEGFDVHGKRVDLPAAFSVFIRNLKEDYPNKTIVFNAVKNWPIEILARSEADFLYIEVWPPDNQYQDLARIIRNARVRSKGKPVVIANYIPASWNANIRLTDAVLFTSGGSRIELGEGDRLLSDPYFPKHEAISPELKKILRRYLDFYVCYGNLIGPAVQRNPDERVRLSSNIWSMVSQGSGWKSVILVNFRGLGDLRWDQKHDAPRKLMDFEVVVGAEDRVIDVLWGSPDNLHWQMQPIPWRREKGSIYIEIPQLEYWGVILINSTTKEQDV